MRILFQSNGPSTVEFYKSLNMSDAGNLAVAQDPNSITLHANSRLVRLHHSSEIHRRRPIAGVSNAYDIARPITCVEERTP